MAGEEMIKMTDVVVFEPMVGKAMVITPPMIPIASATGTHTVMLMKGCLEGDEKNVMLPCGYTSPQYPVPGMGILKIKKLNKDQLSKKTKCSNKKIILKGTKFDSEMSVTMPAMLITPSGPQTDTTASYKGKGQFQTTNTQVKCK